MSELSSPDQAVSSSKGLPHRDRSLVATFSIRTLILTVTMACLLTGFINELERRVVFRRLENRLNDFVARLDYQLTVELATVTNPRSLPVDDSTGGRLGRWIQSEALRESILAVHLFDEKGTVVLSTASELKGRNFPEAWWNLGEGRNGTPAALVQPDATDPRMRVATASEVVSTLRLLEGTLPSGARYRMLVQIVRAADDLLAAIRTAQMVVAIAVTLTAVILFLGNFFAVKAGSLQLERLTEGLEQMVLDRTARLEQRTRELEAIMRSMAEGLVVTDSLDRVVRLNPRALELLGVSEQDILHKPVMELTRLFDLSDVQVTEAISSYYANPRGTSQFEVPPPFPKGSALSITLAKLLDEAGRISGNVAIIREAPDPRVRGS